LDNEFPHTENNDMTDFLIDAYPWTKAFHVISAFAWMAGLWYLPRLFVYHTRQGTLDSATNHLFQTMEVRLLSVIMNPALIATWFFGICLVITPGAVDWAAFWPWTKVAGVLGMTWFHHWLASRRKDFLRGENTRVERTYRIANELPTILLIVIVVSVIVRPV